MHLQTTHQAQQNRHGEKNIQEIRLIISIKEKLKNNNVVATKADKGNSIVIMYYDDYVSKVQDFISHSGAETAKDNLTNRFQADVRRTVNDYKLTLDSRQRWKIINMNPDNPTL
jgi:hypothetical protein